MIAPSLAAYTTDYGYDFVRGEPVSGRNSLPQPLRDLLPGSLKWALKEKIRARDIVGTVSEKIRTSPILRAYVQKVTSCRITGFDS
ncbi:MAG: hypothetical protein MZV63_47065 [Marinilabiliales bacterium]|nr:hypothetical protein [Marinilabiliales bacterium]